VESFLHVSRLNRYTFFVHLFSACYMAIFSPQIWFYLEMILGEMHNLWSSSIRFPLSTSLTIMFLVLMKLFIYIQIKVQTWLQCETFIKHVLTHSESMLMEEQLLLAREREICITVLNRTSSVRSLQYLASLFLCLLIITYERHFRCFIIAFCRLNASDDWKTCYIDCSIVCLCVFVCVCARARGTT